MKPVGALAQVNLVDIKLQNFVFAQAVFNFVGQQHFIQFAGPGFVSGQEEIAGDLHGNGAGALCAPARGDVGHQGPCNAHEVDAAVLVEPIVLGRQNGLLHHQGHLGNVDWAAPFFAKFTDEYAIGSQHAQRHFGSVISQGIEVG